jgi:hypothetical protein
LLTEPKRPKLWVAPFFFFLRIGGTN